MKWRRPLTVVSRHPYPPKRHRHKKKGAPREVVSVVQTTGTPRKVLAGAQVAEGCLPKLKRTLLELLEMHPL
jgi:hypothetical protein